jgi:PKD repeat protein
MDLSTNNPTSWNWVFEGGQPMNSNEQNPEIMYSIPGVYRVTLEVSNNFGTSKAVFDSLITVLPNPESAFDLEQMSDTVQFTNTSSNFTRLEWDFGDGNTSSESDPQHIYEKNGRYTVTLVVFNECGSDTTIKEVVISVSFVNGIEPLGHFSVFPNPNNGQFSVLLKERNLTGTIEAEVRDVVGRQILYRRVDVTDLVNGLNLEIPGSGAGTYILILRQADRMSVYKMTVIQ